MKKLILALILLNIVTVAVAGIEMRLWHSYTHQPSGDIHFSFSVASYRRGLFWGSCGPSTYSLRWMYWLDLAGAGPIYGPAAIKLRNDMDLGLGAQSPVSGEIRLDAKRRRVEIQIQVQEKGVARDFEGNGSYAINEKP